MGIEFQIENVDAGGDAPTGAIDGDIGAHALHLAFQVFQDLHSQLMQA